MTDRRNIPEASSPEAEKQARSATKGSLAVAAGGAKGSAGKKQPDAKVTRGPQAGPGGSRSPGVAPSRAAQATPVPPPPANRHPVSDTRVILQRLTERSVAELQANPALARGLMSRGSYAHLRNNTRLANASFGKAVERLVARYVREDPVLAGRIRHTGLSRGPGGRFIPSPDFTADDRSGTRIFDITTPGEVPKHAKRYGNTPVEYLLYSRPPGIQFP